MTDAPPRQRAAVSRLERSPPQLPTGDTVVFRHTKLPSSRQSSVVAGLASPPAATSLQTAVQPQQKKRRVDSVVPGERRRRLTVRVTKRGDSLGFGVRHDRFKRLRVSTLQGTTSDLRVGDALLSVNAVDLTGLEFLTVVGHLKATRPGELVFEVERDDTNEADGAQQKAKPIATEANGIARSLPATSVATPALGLQLPSTVVTPQPSQTQAWSTSQPATTVASTSPGTVVTQSSSVFWNQNSGVPGQPTAIDKNLTVFGAAKQRAQKEMQPAAALPTVPENGVQPPKKRGRPPQRAVAMLDSNGQPVNITALMADLKKERAEKALLEEKNNGLRKRLQRMLIENDEVRVRASNQVAAAQEKAKREIAEAQNQLAAARAQLRLQDRGPDVGRADSVANDLITCKAQIERLKTSEAERYSLLTARYRGECRMAVAEAQRVLDTLAGMFRTKLRYVGRANRDSANTEVEVACDGVRRLAFMKLFGLAHDFAFYSSAAFHSQEVLHHTIEHDQFTELFGSTLSHEERAGLFYVATAPMHVAYDAKSESITLKCQWAEQNALRDLARNFRS
ncbi:hypothetical protein PHYBOEH_011025 [Phytophthora boehmeriae]|uniref:PDZ domain-containing protein n=1 Tax=Phytophthora boehmeriae TaxID=109152 RepID=A0A8T1X7D9_9STRA|nr:hypothetical protein PHYBOEH_011025 [Phytophthora boehmeriae]